MFDTYKGIGNTVTLTPELAIDLLAHGNPKGPYRPADLQAAARKLRTGGGPLLPDSYQGMTIVVFENAHHFVAGVVAVGIRKKEKGGDESEPMVDFILPNKPPVLSCSDRGHGMSNDQVREWNDLVDCHRKMRALSTLRTELFDKRGG